MQYKDWRNAPQKENEQAEQEEAPKTLRLRGKRYQDYIEEIIQEAIERGEFDNLAGAGKPLNLDEEDNPFAGDKAAGYRVLKQSGYAPPEIELLKEIRRERARLDRQHDLLRVRGAYLRTRTVPPFESEKQAYNAAVTKSVQEYDEQLRNLNRKILSFNLSVPPPMHVPILHTEELVQQFEESCPLLP
jgi:DnaJ family protein C protein 28